MVIHFLPKNSFCAISAKREPLRETQKASNVSGKRGARGEKKRFSKRFSPLAKIKKSFRGPPGQRRGSFASSYNAQQFAFQRGMFANGEREVPLLPRSSGGYVCSFRPAYLPIRTALIPRSLADRVSFRIQKRIQSILGRLPNHSSRCVRFSCAAFFKACFSFF